MNNLAVTVNLTVNGAYHYVAHLDIVLIDALHDTQPK